MSKKNKRILSQPIDLRYFIKLFSNKWPFISSCVLLTVMVAFFVNTCSNPTYEVRSMLVIQEDGNQFSRASSNLFSDIGVFGADKNFANEVQTIQSTSIIAEAISRLDFRISYYLHESLIKKELYKSSPFVVLINPEHPQLTNLRFKIDITTNSSFKLSFRGKDITVHNYKSGRVINVVPKAYDKKEYGFGDQIESENYDFKIVLNSNYKFDENESNSFSFILNQPKDIIKLYQAKLSLGVPDQESTVAEITIESKSPEKAIDFLNSLTETYLLKDVERKNHISIKTIEYIDSQLNIIKDSLQIAEENLQQFRSSNQVTDLSVQANQVYDELRVLENQKAELKTNLKYYEYIKEYFAANQDFSDLITPSGMGIQDPLLNNLIEELIGLNAEKVSLVENNQTKSPYLRKIDIRIDNLKNMISENISYVSKTAEMGMNDLDSRIRQLNAEIRKLPRTERALFGMQRKFNLNDAIYTYLLEKRSEAEISKASYQPDAELLEPADIIGDGPISPNKKINILIALILGISLPISYLRLKEITQTSFKDREDIQRSINLPIFGQIYNNNKKMETVVNTFPKSHIAESFRRMRTNSNYFLSNLDSHVIAVTSVISQDGKSFIALNLAISYAIANSKTLLIGFDLRKPKLFERLDLKETPGISDYLSEQVELEKIIQKSKVDNLDIIWAGKEPPNPAELIASTKTKELIKKLRNEYKYIIIDTAPIGIISDAMMLFNYADIKAIILRLNHTPKKEAAHILDDLKAQKINNTVLIINDIPINKKSSYGYGYYEMKKTK